MKAKNGNGKDDEFLCRRSKHLILQHIGRIPCLGKALEATS